jgi:brefeldin A-resistance guanine nucleotide exchange factor 1
MALPSPIHSGLPAMSSSHHDIPRMQYRSRPVSVAVEPVSLVISECIAITSAIQKHARSPQFSVSAILGGNPNTIHFGSPKPQSQSQDRSVGTPFGDSDQDVATDNRWSFRGQRGKSLQDSPMVAGFGKLRYEITGVQSVYLFYLVTCCQLMVNRYSFI